METKGRGQLHLFTRMLKTVLILGPFGGESNKALEFPNRTHPRFARGIYTINVSPNYWNSSGGCTYTGETRVTGISLLGDSSLPYKGIRRAKYSQ